MSEGRDNHHLTDLEGQGGNLATEVSEIVTIALASTFDEAMNTEALEQTGDLA